MGLYEVAKNAVTGTAKAWGSGVRQPKFEF